ncbi:MAG TPA: hypothetical protein VIG99_12780 [Myxococcaceae bacterium]|jgi:hypothetical protein
MKKVLIGVGIGCGTLMVAGIALAVVGGLWAKKTLGNVAAMGEEVKAQEAEAGQLNQEYPFTAPTKDRPVALTEDRLTAYFAVRDRTMPIHRDFEAKAKEFQSRHPNQEKPDLSAALEATNMVAGLLRELRKGYLQGLREQKMSPREFGAITTAIYTSGLGKVMAAQRPMLQKQIDVLTAQARTATGEQKELLEKQIEALQATLQSMPPPRDEATMTANADLLEQYKDRIKKDANPAFDMWVAAGFGEGLGVMTAPGGEQE